MVYTFDGTMDGLLTAVFDTFERHEQPEALLTSGDALPLFCDVVYEIVTDEAKAQRVWVGLEKRLSREALRLIAVGWLSELQELNNPLYRYICKVFRQDADAPSMERNFADPDVLEVTNIARKVLHEQLRMKQFIRFQKAKDGTYLAVVSPDHNVLPLIVDHFADRFRNQPWLIYDAHRHYGYYYEGEGEDIPPTPSYPPGRETLNSRSETTNESDQPRQHSPFQRGRGYDENESNQPRQHSPFQRGQRDDENEINQPRQHSPFQRSQEDDENESNQPRQHSPFQRGRGYEKEVSKCRPKPVRITFDDEASVPFSLADGKLRDEVMSDDDQLLQDLWRTYFKAICIRERINPRKQLSDMPRRYWKYMTEKQ